MDSLLRTAEIAEAELGLVVEALAREFAGAPKPFCLWLVGPVGAGKTTTVRALLRRWGLPEKIPVTSPTFSYLNDYCIDDATYAHLDLYRASKTFDPEELGLVDFYRFDGLFIEWPSQLPNNPLLEPTHVLEIDFGRSPQHRRFAFHRHS